MLENTYFEHTRKSYGIINILGDLGGVFEILVMIFGLFICRIGEFSFYLEAIKKLYLAKTADAGFFRNQKMKSSKKSDESKPFEDISSKKDEEKGVFGQK